MNTHYRTDNAEPGASQHYRTDRGTLRKPVRTDEGFLILEGVPAVPGVYAYQRADGSIVRELITAEELGKTDSLVSLGRKPITRNHPQSGLVTPATAGDVMVGTVGEKVVVGPEGYVTVTLTVHRGDAIADIESGTRELSCGYLCDVEPAPGVWTDAAGRQHHYDAVQKNRRYNHLAIVDRGRHGPAASMRVDGAVTVATQSGGEPPETPAPKKDNMEFDIRIGGKLYKVKADSKDEANALAQLIHDNESAAKERDQLKGRVDALQAELAKAKDEAKARQDAEPSAEVVRRRIALVMLAEKHGVKREDAIGMDGTKLRAAVIAKAYPAIKVDGQTDGYLDGILATIEAQAAGASSRADGAAVAPGQPAKRDDHADESPLEKAYRERDEQLRWGVKPNSTKH